MTRRAWTVERLLEVLTLASEGHGPESIASQLDEPVEDVEGTLRRLGWLASTKPARRRSRG